MIESVASGPRPAAVAGEGLSAARARILSLLRGDDSDWTVSRLVAETGSHPNTIREHLDALVAAGLARVVDDAPARRDRGRPPTRYRAASPWVAGLDSSLCVGALLAEVAERDDAAEIAHRAGRRWADALQRAVPAELAGAELVELMDALGFDPVVTEGGSVVLRACPMLDAARRDPEVVCSMHLGVAQVLAQSGGTVELQPMGAPEGCVLRCSG